MNRAKSRISTEIIDSILRSVGTVGSTKTGIMYASYISYAELKTYLSILLDKGFIKQERGTRLYKITPDGAEFLESINEIREMIGEPKTEQHVHLVMRGFIHR